MSGSVTRKARLILADIQKNVEEEAKKLSELVSETSEINTWSHALSNEVTSQQAQIKENRIKIQSLSDEILNLENTRKGLMKRNIQLDNEIIDNKFKLDINKDLIMDAVELIELAKREYEESLTLLDKKRLDLDKLNELLETQYKKFALIEGKTKKEEDKLTLLKQKQQDVETNIEESLKKFRIFERRISQFTKDTGYVVGYPRPIRKLNK